MWTYWTFPDTFLSFSFFPLLHRGFRSQKAASFLTLDVIFRIKTERFSASINRVWIWNFNLRQTYSDMKFSNPILKITAIYKILLYRNADNRKSQSSLISPIPKPSFFRTKHLVIWSRCIGAFEMEEPSNIMAQICHPSLREIRFLQPESQRRSICIIPFPRASPFSPHKTTNNISITKKNFSQNSCCWHFAESFKTVFGKSF